MDEVARVREKTDIVLLISEYIELKKMGRNFKALCPFHNEKTPSFVVSAERQIWHCFGCSRGGDCFSFVMEYDKVEFVEALRTLAKKSGIELKASNFQTGLSSKKERIYNLNRLSSDFYHYVLTKHNAGKKALSYLLKERRLDSRLINTFILGFSPNTGNSLSSYLINKKKYKKQDLEEAGLIFERNGRIFDFFRGRIIFPLFDERGNIVGFSARIIDESKEESKYVNTRDTLVYHKGSMFFGLNMAKDEIKNKDRAIIVEGEFDVISMFSHGFKNVVAIKGTAFSQSQASLIARFTKKVTFCLDRDEAGFEALKRSLNVLEEKGLTITVAVFSGKDPDEAIRRNAASFKNAVGKDIGVYDFLITRYLALFGKNTADDKKKIGEELLPLFAQIGNEIVKEHYLKKLSLELATSYESLLKEMERIGRKEFKIQTSHFKKDKRDRREVLEEYLIALIIQSDETKKLFDMAFGILRDYAFAVPAYRKIFEKLGSYFVTNEVFKIKTFSLSLVKEAVPLFDTCFLLPLPRFEDFEKYKKEVEKVLEELRLLDIKEKIKTITQNPKGREKELANLISLLPK